MAHTSRRDSDLPKRCYRKHGAIYHVTKDNRWIRLGKSYAEAMGQYAEILAAESSITTVSDLIAEFTREHLPELAEGTQYNARYSLRFIEHAFGRARPQNIRVADVANYMKERAKHAPARANSERILLGQILNFAVEGGIMDRNPAYECKYRAKIKNKRDRIYVTDEIFKAGFDAVSEPIKCFMLLAVVTGARLGDIVRWKWSDIKEDGIDWIPHKTKKSGKRQCVLFTPQLRAVLKRCKQLSDVSSMHVLCNKHGAPFSENTLSKRLRRELLNNAPEDVRFTAHDLRAKAGSDIADRLDIKAGVALLGNSERVFKKHYKRTANKATANVIDL